jgi:hypothetical protein
MRSFERGEDWSWCYVDEVFFEPAVSPERAGKTGKAGGRDDEHRP